MKRFDIFNLIYKFKKNSNAKRSIPLGIIITLIVVASCYISVSSILTLMMPYYALDLNTPFTHAFQYVGYNWAQYAVSCGAIISLLTWLVFEYNYFYLNEK